MATIIDELRLTPFDRLGGRDAIGSIVDRFYDLMDSEPAYARLRAMHASDLAPMRHSLSGFLAAWCGGPRDWFEENPGKCMMSAHASFAVDTDVAGQWADAMRRAIDDVETSDAEIAQLLSQRLSDLARAMART